MKKIVAAALLGFTLIGCTDKKKQEKDLFNEVIKTHDQVMMKEEMIMTTKMQLDTLIKNNVSPAVTIEAAELSKKLESADSKMEDWMHNFDAENKNKSHDEIMTYLADQKKQIDSIDKQLNTAVATSSKFIKQNKVKWNK